MLTRRSMLTNLGAAATLAGCGKEENRPKPGTGKVEDVTFVTGFNITGQDSYVFAAIENGFYRDAGLNVTVVPGVGTRGNLQYLARDTAQFATIDITGGLLEIDGGRLTDFRVFAAIYQLTVSCIVALPAANIASPRDLAGKRIGYSEGGVNKTIFPAYARLAGLDEATVRWVSLAPPLIRPALLSGQLDASTEIVVGRPALEAAAKQSVTMLPYSDVMRDLYGNAIGASTSLIERNPGLVRRFRDASLRGMRWTLDNPDAAGRVMAKHNPTYRAEVAAAEVRQTVTYVRGGAPVLGHLDEARMARCIAVVQSIGLVRPGLTPDRIAAFDLVPTA
ncbi:ABC transporter substrate-binding protein [Virgisporangium ochraceum]|uniref:ABC transporter substrate-binding protein n=1 Tax=Virgisporangium ochraceum TaxID=65505 RepID=UPI001942B250|nr:ABC transporter substrate-binding protein [Virgisporangium ochraceum]